MSTPSQTLDILILTRWQWSRVLSRFSPTRKRSRNTTNSAAILIAGSNPDRALRAARRPSVDSVVDSAVTKDSTRKSQPRKCSTGSLMVDLAEWAVVDSVLQLPLIFVLLELILSYYRRSAIRLQHGRWPRVPSASVWRPGAPSPASRSSHRAGSSDR